MGGGWSEGRVKRVVLSCAGSVLCRWIEMEVASREAEYRNEMIKSRCWKEMGVSAYNRDERRSF